MKATTCNSEISCSQCAEKCDSYHAEICQVIKERIIALYFIMAGVPLTVFLFGN